MPIFIAPHNVDLQVVKILLDPSTKKHLENLGITIGSKLQVLSWPWIIILLWKSLLHKERQVKFYAKET